MLGGHRIPVIVPGAVLVDPDQPITLVDPNAPGPQFTTIGQHSAFKTSTGVEIRFFMPVLNVPFRLIFAYNPQRGGVLRQQRCSRRRRSSSGLPSDRPSSRGTACIDCSARVPASGVALLLVVALATGACSNNPVLPTNPITGVPVTDSFSGTLSKNGAFTHAFSIASLGSITAAIVGLAPNTLTDRRPAAGRVERHRPARRRRRPTWPRRAAASR